MFDYYFQTPAKNCPSTFSYFSFVCTLVPQLLLNFYEKLRATCFHRSGSPRRQKIRIKIRTVTSYYCQYLAVQPFFPPFVRLFHRLFRIFWQRLRSAQSTYYPPPPHPAYRLTNIVLFTIGLEKRKPEGRRRRRRRRRRGSNGISK